MRSDSESESPFVDLLESLYDELTECAISSKKIYYAAKESSDLYEDPQKLRREPQAYFKTKRISTKDLLSRLMPSWTLSANGYHIHLPAPHVSLLHIPEESDVYTVILAIGSLFEPVKK